MELFLSSRVMIGEYVKGNPTLDQIAMACSDVYYRPIEQLATKDRKSGVIEFRHMFIWVARQMGHKVIDIAAYIKHDHTSVVHACQKMRDYFDCGIYLEMNRKYNGIINLLS